MTEEEQSTLINIIDYADKRILQDMKHSAQSRRYKQLLVMHDLCQNILRQKILLN